MIKLSVNETKWSSLLARDPFLESPAGNVSGPKSNFQRIRARVLASKLLRSVLLTGSLIMLDVKLLKPLPCM